MFVAENVKGITMGAAKNLLGSDQMDMFGEHKNTIIHTLIDCGYNVRHKVIAAKDYGAPQLRERTIFIGVRKDINIPISYPKPFNETVTLEEAFEDLNHSDNDLLETNIEKYAIYKEALKIKPGESSEKYFSLVKQRPNRYSDTLTQTAGSIGAASVIHWDNRKFTVKEAIRIMGFPDDYYLGETYQNKIERLGRAVVPLMMKEVAGNIYKTILSKIN